MATQALDMEDRNMSIGRVFERAFGVMGAEPLTVFGIAFLFGALPQLVLNYALKAVLAGTPPTETAKIFAIALIPTLISMIAIMVVQGALVRTTIAYSEGQHAGFGLSCATGLRMVLPMIGLTIITALGLSAATLLLLIPGIMLFLMWCVATPALVAERCGIFGSLGRSRYLTKGARWKIFGLYLMIMVVFWLILIGFILIVGVAGLASMGQHPSVASAAINAILNTLLLAFLATLSSSLFVELRNWKEGAAPDQLADVFA